MRSTLEKDSDVCWHIQWKYLCTFSWKQVIQVVFMKQNNPITLAPTTNIFSSGHAPQCEGHNFFGR